MINVESLNKIIKGKAILKDISFEVTDGDCGALIGRNGAGKTTFIKRRYENHEGVSCLNVWDYQDRAYREAGYLESIPFGASFRCLMKANSELLQDVIEKLKDGDVVIEQTFFKAKRSML